MQFFEIEYARIQSGMRIDRNEKRVSEGLRSTRPYVQRHETCQLINEFSNHSAGDPRLAGRHGANSFDEKPSEQLRIEISSRALRNSSENVGIRSLPCQQNDLRLGTFRPKKGKRRGIICSGHLEIQQKNMRSVHGRSNGLTNSVGGCDDRHSRRPFKKTPTDAEPSCVRIGNDDSDRWHVLPYAIARMAGGH